MHRVVLVGVAAAGASAFVYTASAQGVRHEEARSGVRVPEINQYRVPLGQTRTFNLKAIDPNDTGGLSRKECLAELRKDQKHLDHLQQVFYADGKRRLLLVLQAVDTGGKDGTIRHVMRTLNPQGITVKSFKKPTVEEASHHFLWRVWNSLQVPGTIQVFNRSQYEDILVPSVYHTVPAFEIQNRYKAINEFERELTTEGWVIVKIFLYISKDEQKRRLQERLDNPDKYWKFDMSDIIARKKWNDFQNTYEKIFTLTNTPWAPWYIVPANNKWYRDFVVGRILRQHLEEMDLHFPPPNTDIKAIQLE